MLVPLRLNENADTKSIYLLWLECAEGNFEDLFMKVNCLLTCEVHRVYG